MKNQKETIKLITKTVSEFFKDKNGIDSIILFGSYAKGTQTNQSDIDLAILFDPTQIPSKLDIIFWKQELSDLLKKEIDIICLNDASPILGMQVEQNNIPLLTINPLAYEKYKIILYSDYAELKELRAQAEKQILERKYYDK